MYAPIELDDVDDVDDNGELMGSGIREGVSVMITGLAKRDDLNGCIATAVDFHPAGSDPRDGRARWRVQLQGRAKSEAIKVRPECLVLAEAAPSPAAGRKRQPDEETRTTSKAAGKRHKAAS